jgi:hypothetical protein
MAFTVPEEGIFENPAITVSLNQHWLSYLDGAIGFLLLESLWEGDEEALEHAQEQIRQLLAAFAPLAPESFTLFGEDPVTPGSTNTDPDAVYLGVNFRSSVPGQVTAIRFFKLAGSAGPHVGYLWSDACVELAQAEFESETTDGWQEVAIAPVTIEADTDYVASVYFPAGGWNRTTSFFTADHENDPLTAPAADNGRYVYPAFGTCPAFTFENTNYWIDLRFIPS